jgi:hypothetical protein
VMSMAPDCANLYTIFGYFWLNIFVYFYFRKSVWLESLVGLLRQTCVTCRVLRHARWAFVMLCKMGQFEKCLGRGLSWFWFAVGSWRICWGGGGDGDQQAVWSCRDRCAWPGLFWAARGWSRAPAGAWKWRSAGVHLRAETLAVSMVNVACQTDSLA